MTGAVGSLNVAHKSSEPSLLFVLYSTMSTSSRQQPPRKSRPESLKESPGSATLSPDRMLHKSDESWDHSSPLPPARQSLYRTPDKHVFHGSTISQKARDAAIDAAPMGDSCAITFADNNLGTVEMAHVISRATSGGTVCRYKVTEIGAVYSLYYTTGERLGKGLGTEREAQPR